MHPALVLLIVLLDLPFFYWFAMVAFGSMDKLGAAAMFWLRPALRAGERQDRALDAWAEVKLVGLVTAYTLVVLAQMALLNPLIGASTP